MTPRSDPVALTNKSDGDLALLIGRDYVDYAARFDAAPGVTTIRTPELLARRGDLAHPYLNLVLGTWADEGSVGRVIDDVRTQLGGPGRGFTWGVWPGDRPVDLRERLQRAGLSFEGDGPLMALDLATADLPADLTPGLTIELATDPSALHEAGPVTMASVGGDPEAQAVYVKAYEALAFGSEPTLRYFVGRVDGRPVATSALYTGTGLAGLVGIGTLPDMRGRGYGRALTVAALREGRRLGLRLGGLMSSDLGLPVYRRLGFREVGSVGFFSSAEAPT